MTKKQELQTTPFHSYHLSKGAKMVDFAGWEMPLHYGSIIEEHQKIRQSGGFFDVSHMGRIRFIGKDACHFLDKICTRQIFDMAKGQTRYSLICNENGGCRDDVLVNCISHTEFLVVCNGANLDKINSHIQGNKGNFICKIIDETASTAMLAVQGPEVMNSLKSISNEISELKRYRFVLKNLPIPRLLVVVKMPSVLSVLFSLLAKIKAVHFVDLLSQLTHLIP